MQFLKIKNAITLAQLAAKVGANNVDRILVANELKRSPRIGQQFADKCEAIQATRGNVSVQRKQNILNTLTSDEDVYEEACLLSESGWKILDALGTLPGTLRIPETITLKDSVDVLGGSNSGVTQTIYVKSIKCLTDYGYIDPSIFNEYSTNKPVNLSQYNSTPTSKTDMYNAFNLPWGKIQLYSSLSDSLIDFPVYPEQLSDGAKANFTQMDGIIYQYEPWYTYESSGPREMSYTFHFHRDMWSGNHLDGKANELIRFCEANCYPDYNGSAVHAATVRLYINGAMHISGILTSVQTTWSGPLGQDGWYLECELTLNITEVATAPKTFQSVRQQGLIGGI